ncbi:MAG: efflux RND transporter periplasmic adaptor subunit [Balneolaceae bacterium]|nr:MAG: efflux RND transporter periplasmic adaptor subunit [Balneolaceae bacterium]
MKPVVKRSLLAGVVLVVFGLLIWNRVHQGNNSSAGAEAQRQGEPSAVPVEGYLVEPEPFRETIFTTGNVLADEEIYIRPETSGRITGIYFEEDSEVKAGDLLVKLNDAELQQEHRRISYQINLARIREQRQKELLARNAIAQDDYDMVLNELNTLKAQSDRVQAQIDKMEIRAPFDGVIGLQEVSTGSFVTPDVLISNLQKIDYIKIDFSIPERYRPSVRRDQTIRFQVEGSQEMLEGRIYALQPRVDRDTRTLRMRAIAPNPGALILPGAFARVEVDLSQIDEALLIPSEALVPEMTGYSVFVYRDGRAHAQEVQIGTRTDRRVQIREGLAPQDTVITTGLLQIRDGMPVRLANIRTEIRDEVTEL